MQGVHLNTEGNRQVAQVIDRTLFGDSPKHQEALLGKLRQAVVDKDKHWFLRYRVTDGYSTYGDRAFLTFVRGNPRNVDAKQMASVNKEDVLPSNYDVLQRELPILDLMIANRDKRIWAIAGGSGPCRRTTRTRRRSSMRKNKPGRGRRHARLPRAATRPSRR